MLINVGQGIAAKYEYDPYGNILSLSGSLAAANAYRFSSKEYLQNSGLIYYTNSGFTIRICRDGQIGTPSARTAESIFTLTLETIPLVTMTHLGFLHRQGGMRRLRLGSRLALTVPRSFPGGHGGFTPLPPVARIRTGFSEKNNTSFTGSGFTRVSCCDDKGTKKIFWYRKICIGVPSIWLWGWHCFWYVR